MKEGYTVEYRISEDIKKKIKKKQDYGDNHDTDDDHVNDDHDDHDHDHDDHDYHHHHHHHHHDDCLDFSEREGHGDEAKPQVGQREVEDQHVPGNIGEVQISLG